MKTTHIRGFTLLEVMVALLIFSLGLLGVAGLLAVSVKTNHSAYLRTQATFLAQGMADRMRANVLGLWNNSYNFPLAAVGNPAIPGTCTSPNSCAYSDVAARDLIVWQRQLTAFLPAAQAMINCTVPGGITAPSATQILSLPPYAGLCEIQLVWNESRLTGDDNPGTETFDWVFQP